MTDRLTRSPREQWVEACWRGELTYQLTPDGRPVFHPRVVAPSTGETELEWRTSSGRGTVYATTTVHPRGGEPYDVSLIDLDEGFRMMSRVEGIAPDEVRIGMRVRVRFVSGEDGKPLPVFVPDGGSAR